MNTKTWEQVTHAALGKVVQYFKPKEVATIMDFICMAKEDISSIVDGTEKQENGDAGS